MYFSNKLSNCILAINSTGRYYVSLATRIEERTTHIALLSLFQTMGFIIGPGIQAISLLITKIYKYLDFRTFHATIFIEKILAFQFSFVSRLFYFPELSVIFDGWWSSTKF